MKSNLSLIQSIIIKLAVFSIGAGVILWFGWSVPQANQPKFNPSQVHNVSQEVEKAAFLPSMDINQGTKEELQTLPGIGPVLAGRIIGHRESRGLFTRIEDLKAVEGIGEKKLAQLRPYITVNQPSNIEPRKSPAVTEK